jgi:spore maturation protein CgeB
MKILYLGTSNGTSLHRINAMRRLGQDVTVTNPNDALPHNAFMTKLHRETGGLLAEKRVTAFLQSTYPNPDFDIVWVDGGRHVGPSLIQWFQSMGIPVVNYNFDDPYGKRDRFSWSLYLRAVAFYNAVVVVRPENIEEAKQRRAKQVIHVFRCADEVAHAPSPEPIAFRHDVLFVGTWMPERSPLMRELLSYSIPLTIVGNRWDRAPEWPHLRAVWKGPGTEKDNDYAMLIQSARICLGLLSRGNRDRHTTRSLEIPSLGSVFCAERTDEHEALYDDGKEAVFWSSAAECARLCKALFQDEARRAAIAHNGRERCLRNGHFNETFITRVLNEVTTPRRQKQRIAS